MGTPSPHPCSSIFNGMFLHKPSIFGYPHLWNPPDYNLLLLPGGQSRSPKKNGQVKNDGLYRAGATMEVWKQLWQSPKEFQNQKIEGVVLDDF